jgi:single-strand DNA-binding protein
MSRGINKWIGIGHLGRDPETRRTQGGDAVTSFSIAVSESYKNKQGEQVDKTEWVNCVTFARLAEIAAEYLRKGSKVYIEGKLQTDSYEKDGVKQYSTKVNVRELQMLDSRASGPSAGTSRMVDEDAPPF